MCTRIDPIFFCCMVAAAQQGQTPSETPTYRTGTRLVQVEVVVRDRNGPVKGLTKEDFTLVADRATGVTGSLHLPLRKQ
jgi:hypothetical protein